jgi:AcrR family transcriptional regulator
MPESALSRKQASANRRSAILEAARTVFARQGYTDTVVEDIADQAGIGKGTLYLYFPSKEQIYLAALLDDGRVLDAQSRQAMAESGNWREAIRAFVMVRLRYFDAHQDFLRIYVTEFHSMFLLGKPLTAELFRLIQESEAQLAEVFRAAAAHGEIRDVDPELTALTVSDLTRGLMERRLRVGGHVAGPEDDAFAIDFLCRGLEP